jgi:hypothetical protein
MPGRPPQAGGGEGAAEGVAADGRDGVYGYRWVDSQGVLIHQGEDRRLLRRGMEKGGGMKRIVGLGAVALALGACGGGAGNNAAVQNRTEAPSANAVANAAQEGPRIPIDERRLLETCVPANERELTIDQLAPARRASLNRCYNEETVRQLTPQLPIRVDRLTEVIQVSVQGQDLIYRYRIGRRLADMPGVGDRLDTDTRRHACAGPDVRNIIALGGAQVYQWVDQDGAPIRDVRVDACPEEGTTTR